MFVRNICLVAVAISATGCATVVRGTTEDVVINYAPADANVTTSLGHKCSASPCTVNVERKKEFQVVATKKGFQQQVVDVGTKVSGKGVAGMAGNVLVGGVVGVGVDAATGASKDHFPNPVNIELVPLGATPAEPPKVPTPKGKPKKSDTPVS